MKLFNTKYFSFSQSGEDYNVRNIFKEKRDGFYVDIGAYHPFNVSNTVLLYLFYNWKGINIDAMPGSMETFRKYRKRDINLEFAVSSQQEELTYYIIDETSTMNTFSREFLEENNVLELVQKEIKINAYPLSEILDKYLPADKNIDLLNIDVESMELKVLQSNNWEKYRPKCIIMEFSGNRISEIETSATGKLLKELGYELWVVTYLAENLRNVIFVDTKNESQIFSSTIL